MAEIWEGVCADVLREVQLSLSWCEFWKKAILECATTMQQQKLHFWSDDLDIISGREKILINIKGSGDYGKKHRSPFFEDIADNFLL